MHESHGRYTIHNGYKVAMEQNPIVALQNFDFWSIVWKAQLPLKIKHHVWRALMDTLPCNVNLKRHHVDISKICPVYGLEAKTVLHWLLFCRAA